MSFIVVVLSLLKILDVEHEADRDQEKEEEIKVPCNVVSS